MAHLPFRVLKKLMVHRMFKRVFYISWERTCRPRKIMTRDITLQMNMKEMVPELPIIFDFWDN
jgi:hypothetical protein